MENKETIYYLETDDGGLIRVPESKLEDFIKMQDKIRKEKESQNKSEK